MHQAKDYEVRIWRSEEDGVFVARCVEMPGIMAHGDTLPQAAVSIQEAIALNLECCQQDGEQPPVPSHRLAAA